jgi:hypothetical protein
MLEVSREGQMITISGSLMNSDQIILTEKGPQIVLTYDAIALRHLWGQLGEAIQQAEAETVHEPKQGGF